ncbi:MAG TPA: glutathione S-transferase family protein [Candidatus Binataceae bacterium]|nr:glutathione S-transferase family protein [Candidatus Binataceae bacterium]
MIKMYDLAAAEPDRRLSPFCWRTKLALAHKQLEVETIPWRFTDKPQIAFANWERVPVIVDDGKPVVDSWAIASYLETAYPARPSLFGGAAGPSLARFYNAWADTALQPAMIRFNALDIFNHLAQEDRAYFRQSREARFGTTLEEFCKDRESRLPAFTQLLDPLRQTLAAQPFLGGDAPLYPDYIVFGSFMWSRSICPLRLLEPADPVNAWRERLLDAFGGLARRAPGYW